MTMERVEALNDIGFEWELTTHKRPLDDKGWQRRYEEGKNGPLQSPSSFIENKALGTWVATQRSHYRRLLKHKQSNMTMERVEALNDIGFEWELTTHRKPLDDKGWQRRYEELKQFRARTGHCRVPRNFIENEALGRGVSHQRQDYKLLIEEMTIERAEALNDIGFTSKEEYRLLIEDKPSQMTIERAEALNDIGFQWEGRFCDKAWQRRYDELKQFRARTGHCRVPVSFNENKALGTWVSHQRQEYKHLIEDKPSQMTIERAEALNDIGFEWEGTTSYSVMLWQRRYDELKQFKARTGHCRVPDSFTENKALGMWVSTQRTHYKLLNDDKPSLMTFDRVEALNNIGFEW
eukprot:CAMPEP_0172522484 /NCGR_PEP_ID=MMETSP1066-20121228/293144_1 /TAXON_ID=671091 /ORGANISM="Coscinodiscus wailesii, Strain CCMP2513" /LENGTH=349 /DNA_ID=CAMNT_0013305489 /DNA_START=217 /DNA_END=1265 /DNA_ORIENTATION=-